MPLSQPSIGQDGRKVSKEELDLLKEHVDFRFQALQDYLKEVADAIKRLTENQERLILVEVSQNQTQKEVHDIRKRVRSVEIDVRKNSMTLIKVVSISGVIASIITTIAVPVALQVIKTL